MSQSMFIDNKSAIHTKNSHLNRNVGYGRRQYTFPPFTDTEFLDEMRGGIQFNPPPGPPEIPWMMRSKNEFPDIWRKQYGAGDNHVRMEPYSTWEYTNNTQPYPIYKLKGSGVKPHYGYDRPWDANELARRTSQIRGKGKISKRKRRKRNRRKRNKQKQKR